MNKKNSKQKMTEAFIAQGSFQVSKMKPGVTALIETTVGTLYTLRLLNPFDNLVEFWATEELFRNRPAVPCYFLESWSDRKATIAVPDLIVKGGLARLLFSDGDYLCHPVKSALLDGPGWKYEVIKP